MNKQTSVEWFLDQLTHRKELYDSEGYSIAEEMAKLKHEARQMHRQEIVKAHIEGQRIFDNHPYNDWNGEQGEKYYSEIFGGNNE